VKFKNINNMKILVAVMQFLFEDIRTDRQTDMANLQYDPFEFVIVNMLRIIAALTNQPVGFTTHIARMIHNFLG
jgi:hypothetical protein